MPLSFHSEVLLMDLSGGGGGVNGRRWRGRGGRRGAWRGGEEERCNGKDNGHEGQTVLDDIVQHDEKTFGVFNKKEAFEERQCRGALSPSRTMS